jgi:hypothetical protein
MPVSKYQYPMYTELQDAFDFYNETLFNNELPKCIITIRKKPNSFGYLHPNRFLTKGSKEYSHELALNPEYFIIRDIELSMATLVHEMVHLLTFLKGVYGSGGYHNKAWAEGMKKVGLIPSSTGEPGGKETGESISHYIDPAGEFIRQTRLLIERGYTLDWYEVSDKTVRYFTQEEFNSKVKPLGEHTYEVDEKEVVKGSFVKRKEGEYALIVVPEDRKMSGVRVKYRCDCANVWGKSGLSLRCNDCGKDMVEE